MIPLEFQIVLAFFLDAIIGDPPWLPHPVRAIGNMAKIMERLTRFIVRWDWGAGCVAVTATVGTTVGIAFLSLHVAGTIHPAFGDVVSIYCIYFCIALRDLLKHTRRVHTALTTETLEQARHDVSMIVGRDTHELDETDVARATVESVAESFLDGIAAPLFYAALFGPLGAVAYRAINTLDSMFGYRNKQYRHFGWTAAKLDDVANFLPSRLSAPFLVLAAGLTGHSMQSAYRILVRDRRNHSSPNAGLPEAAMAGALEVQLGGPALYFGEWVEKPTIGDSTHSVRAIDILRANRIVIVATITFLVCCVLVRLVASENLGATTTPTTAKTSTMTSVALLHTLPCKGISA